MKLSILIPTVVGREQDFDSLMTRINNQIANGNFSGVVEVLSLKDNKEISIGEKRNRLYDMASGEYAVQIDDDDGIADDYIHRVLNALRHDVDCIGYQEFVTGHGRPCRSDFSLRYKEWKSSDPQHLICGLFRHVRTPFHKTPIRTEIARSVKFKDLRFGEDHQWAIEVYPLLHTEVYINELMYFYNYRHQDTNEKYGIK